MPLFTLEALNADEGDCLILHYGDPASPRLIVIDGGPRDVFEVRLSKRLEDLRKTYDQRGWLDSKERLPIEMAMVSHIDNDHIVGILKWTDQIVDRRKQGQPEQYAINTLWHNSFDDILDNDQYGLLASLASRVSAYDGVVRSSLGLDAVDDLEDDLSLILAGVPQGRQLRDNARELKLNVNLGFKKLIMAPKKGKKTINWDDGLTLTVLSPPQDKLAKLQGEWDDKIRGAAASFASQPPSDELLLELAKYGNLTIPNRASIVVLAELGGKRMLLTGDARGDDITEGLTRAGLMQNGTFHVDLLKMQHHGSKNNFDETFFEQIRADHYVISGDGGHGNPHPDVLDQFVRVRGNSDCILWLTNEKMKTYKTLTDKDRVTKFWKAQKAAGKKFKMLFRDPATPSLHVDLLDPLQH